MVKLLATALVGIAGLGCAIEEPRPAPPNGDVFELEPGMFVSRTATDGKADLPNHDLIPRPVDTSGYRAIAETFVAAGYDGARTAAPLALTWPLPSSHAVLARQGTPIRLAWEAYEHTGLDIIRTSLEDATTVVAPVTGKAQITDWNGERAFPWGDYSTVISIWDPVTHVVVQIMHVKPTAELPREGFFDVTAGQVLGELADIAEIPDGLHIHVNVIDAQRFELIDPVTAFPSYPDTTAPTIGAAYLLDRDARKHETLVDGPLDLAVAVFDRDDASPRNLEIASIGYTVRDQTGAILASLRRCHLSDAYEKLVTGWDTSSSTLRLIDFGNGSGLGGFWPDSDVGMADKQYRYALTHLRNDGTSCSIVATDRDGELLIGPEITKLTVEVRAWDARGNQRIRQQTLTR